MPPHKHSPPTTPAHRAVKKARAYIEAHPDERVLLKDLASLTGMSPYHLQRTFTNITGLSPREYRDAVRIKHFKKHLKSGDSVSRATYGSGFGSSNTVYTTVRDKLGMTPGEYRRGGKGVSITYTIQRSKVGKTLIAATDRGICAVFLDDKDSVLEDELRAEFPNAQVEKRTKLSGKFGEWVQASLNHINGSGDAKRLPFDNGGTPFQRRVWDALQQIPAGETRTYGEIALEIGAPNAVRAVGTACGSNNIAVLIPCHRVLRSGGGLGGYRWNLERKKKLLEMEKALKSR